MSVDVGVRSTLGEHADEWDALVDIAPIPSPYLRSWWLEATSAGDPRFVLVSERGQLLGGVALDADSVLGVERLRIMGHGPNAPDHVDLVALPERSGDVVDALSDWFDRPGPRIIDLIGISELTRLGDCLPGRVKRTVEDIAPWTPLPPTFDEWLAQRSKSTRNKIRRALRRFDTEEAEIRRVTTDQLEAALDRLRDLHEGLFGETSLWLPGFGAFSDAARAGVPRGELVIHEMTLGGRVVASETWFEYAGRLSFCQGGRLTDDEFASVGTALMSDGVRSACDRGFVELDFLRGGSDYKLRWTTDRRDVVRLRATRGVRGRLGAATLRAAWRWKEWRQRRRHAGE